MRYAFDDTAAAERHETQYFEMFGNRGIYHKGWTAVTRHKTPWLLVGEKTPAFDDDVWELYDTGVDWTQFEDVSAQHPDRLHELQRLFLIEATRYNVLPLDDRVAERLLAGGRRAAGPREGEPAAALRRHGPADGELGGQHQEPLARRDGGDRGAGGRRAGRDHRPGRQHRRLEPVPEGGAAALLLQPPRRPALLRRQRRGDPGGHPPGADGVRLRRPGARQGRHRAPVPRRRRSARVPSRRRQR